MFYFLLSSLVSYNGILIVAAVVPAIFLMVKVYQSDHLERESTEQLWRLVRAGIFSALIALVLERVFSTLLELMVPQNHPYYQVLLYFVVVAFSEEGAKYFMLRRTSWNSPEFNCQYDGVVYAVFVALGFALWENISYVLHYGFSTAIIRAVTAIPGHTCFGVFMGVFYGLARRSENGNDHDRSIAFRIAAVVIPALLHGAYDYIASTDTTVWYFVGFIVTNEKQRRLQKMMTMNQKVRSVAAMILLTLLIVGAIFTVAAIPAHADNCYEGAWVMVMDDGSQIRMDIFNDGTVQIVYPDDPGTGYLHEYVFWDDGELVVLDDGSAILFAVALYDWNTMADTDGDFWYRVG